MSITEELREWASIEVPYKYGHQLAAIADRIDEEHTAVLKSLGMTQAERDEYLESCRLWEFKCGSMVELPRDADGVPIRIGDRMDFTKNVCNLTVLGIGIVDASESSLGEFGLGVFVREGSDYVWYNAEFLHHHAPTVEDVLREFADAMSETHPLDVPARIAEYAQRLRLAGDAE